MKFDEHDHALLASLFQGVEAHGKTHGGGGFVTVIPYAGYKPDVREAPNGDTNVDAGPAAKRWLHVADKYDPPAWARAYQDRAYAEACRVAEALGVPKAYWPMPSVGALRVLEYPSAGHAFTAPTPLGYDCEDNACVHCGVIRCELDGQGVCPALAAGAGTAEHTDPNLFTIVLWRSTPADLELVTPAPDTYASAQGEARRRMAAREISPGLHIGEIGELVGLGPPTPHRVPARPYVQKSIVYYAIPDHAAVLPQSSERLAADGPLTVGEWLAERMARSRVQKGSY